MAGQTGITNISTQQEHGNNKLLAVVMRLNIETIESS
jgi:hypothetical protein